MHSEHVQNLHPGWVVGGWLLSLAVMSAAFLIGVGLGFIGPDRPGTGLFVPITVALGFFAGGLFVGVRWTEAPILHGSAMTLLTIVFWFAGSLLLPDRASGGSLGLDRQGFVLGMILLQLASAVGGGLAGRYLVLRGEPDPTAV